MSNDQSIQTHAIEDINDITDHIDYHRESYTPMCKASFSTEKFKSDSYIEPFTNNAAALKNRRLVTILKEKIFKGFSKLKQKKVEEEEPIIAINSRVWKVTRKGEKKKKQTTAHETIKSSSQLGTDFIEIRRMGSTLRMSDNKFDTEDEQRHLFITEKPKMSRVNKIKLPTEEEKQDMLLKRILGNNMEEGKCYSLLNFRPFEIKRPHAVTHYNANRLRLENEMYDQANEEMIKTTKSEFLFKISRPIKEDPTDTSKNINFNTNPGLIKSVKKYTQLTTKPEDDDIYNNNEIIYSTNDEKGFSFSNNDNMYSGAGAGADNHIDRMKKIARMRDSVNKKMNQEKSRFHFLRRRQDEINEELQKLAFLESELGNIVREPDPVREANRTHYQVKRSSMQRDSHVKLKPLTKTASFFVADNLKNNIYEGKQNFKQLKDIVLLKERINYAGDQKYETARDKNVFKILNNIQK
jgi:hypothetical protein